MIFVETSAFTRIANALFEDDGLRLLQEDLARNPERGKVIRGTGSLRKLRWTLPGRGKRGGARVIYYWAVQQDQILMLYGYAKNERENLTPQQANLLAQIIREEYP